RRHAQALERLVVPVRIVLLAGEDECDLEAVAVAELPRGGGNDADAAAELPIGEGEGDPPAAASGCCGADRAWALRTWRSAARARSNGRSARTSAAGASAAGPSRVAPGPNART